MPRDRIVAGDQMAAEDENKIADLRPKRLEDYIGQRKNVELLKISLGAAKKRGEPLDHVLFHGPPGLGKTTLAYVIAAEMGRNIRVTSGPAITRPSDLMADLTNLEEGDILFIDEIHRLPISVEEFIYPAMEDFRIDVPVDSGLHARTVQITLKPFTLIGATTRAGLVSAPLRSRFGITHHLQYYGQADLETIVRRSAGLLSVQISDAKAVTLIASRSRGTPRIANRLLRRVRDYAQVHGSKKGGGLGAVTIGLVEDALTLEGIDAMGLDELDRRYMRTIGTTYQGGPVGVEAVAATLNEDAGTLESVVEPYLLQLGFVARMRRGRMLTARGAAHAGGGCRAGEGLAEGVLFDE
jgi:Holliday junction DNA helicase RuvB